jgi:hypothetical protein
LGHDPPTVNSQQQHAAWQQAGSWRAAVSTQHTASCNTANTAHSTQQTAHSTQHHTTAQLPHSYAAQYQHSTQHYTASIVIIAHSSSPIDPQFYHPKFCLNNCIYLHHTGHSKGHRCQQNCSNHQTAHRHLMEEIRRSLPVSISLYAMVSKKVVLRRRAVCALM